MDYDDQYVKQLEDIFNSYCTTGDSTVDQSQLTKLCERLSLNQESIDHIQQLAVSDQKLGEKCVNLSFSKFCDYFVAALSKAGDDTTSDHSSSSNEENIPPVSPVLEVTPRLVRRGKAYGRRSTPLIDSKKKKLNVNGNELEAEIKNDIIEYEKLDSLREDKMLYYEPLLNNNFVQKGKYFEATGICEITPNKEVHDKRVKLSSSTMFPSNQEVISIIKICSSSNQSHFCIADNTGVYILRIYPHFYSDSFLDASLSFPSELNELNLFPSLQTDQTGLIEVDRLLDLWSQSGVKDPHSLLKALDMLECIESGLVKSTPLSTTLHHEVVTNLKSQPHTLHTSMTLALLYSHKFYFHHVNSELTRYRRQVERMKEDLNRSELRHSKIAEEADDRCVGLDEQHEIKLEGLERMWNRKLSSAHRNFERERESILIQTTSEKEELYKEIELLRSSENLLRRKVNILNSENKTLSEDVSRIVERLKEAEKDADRLRKDLECLVNGKLGDESDPINTSQEEKFAMIIKDYEAQCRHLADRNDELATENREFKSQLRQQEARINTLNFEQEKNSLTRRKNMDRRRRSNGSMEDITDASLTDDLSDIERRFNNSSPDQSMALHLATVRMRELEQLVEDLRSDKRRAVDDFALEKAELKAKFEEEYHAKIDAEHSRSRCYDDNRAVEEQWIMTKKLLEETGRERDELETKYKEIKESMDRETSNGERELANLCRQFADEKSELTAKFDKKVNTLKDEMKSINQKLKEEEEANQRLTNQLKFERTQHQEALATHQEIVTKFEKNAASRDNDVNQERMTEVKKKHVEEVERLKRDHVAELESLKRNTEERLETLLSEKQIHDNSSMGDELERLHESIGVERDEMHERMHEMREAFEHEAIELRQLMSRDKAKLIELLNEEVALMRQKIAEEGEMELKRRKRAIEEEWRKHAEVIDAHLDESEEIKCLRSDVASLRDRNSDLERLLSKSRSSLKQEEDRVSKIAESKLGEDALRSRLEDAKRDLVNKDLDNKSLRMQVEAMMKEDTEVKLMMSSLRTQCREKESQCDQLQHYNSDLTAKVSKLEEECRAVRIDNAGLAAKCEKLEKITPTPAKRHNAKEKKPNEEEEERIKEMKEEIDKLRSQLVRKQGDVTNLIDDAVDDVFFDAECSSSHSSEKSAVGVIRERLTQTRQQLADHLGRMKDLYCKLSKSETLVKDLYCENAHLMRALQVTEARQREAENRRDDEKEKNQILTQLVRDICREIM